LVSDEKKFCVFSEMREQFTLKKVKTKKYFAKKHEHKKNTLHTYAVVCLHKMNC